MEPQIDLRFSSPVCRTMVSGLDQHRDDIVELASSLRAEDDAGVVSSNFGGWHSRRDAHTRDADPMQWLVRKISRESAGLIRRLSTRTTGLEIILKECWFNVLSPGGWNMPHTHPAWWSGVLYISGDFEAEGGDIMFLNPVPLSQRGGYPSSFTITPEPGLLLLFPGHLSHMVTPYEGRQPRISVSFNIDPVDKD